MNGEEEEEESLGEQIAAIQKAREAERRLRVALMRVLDGKAYERLMNVRIANPELYARIANALLSAYQRLGRKITEKELLTILSKLTERKESGIEIRRK